MKENQRESCQKCFLVKTYEWHKKSFMRWINQEKNWLRMLKIDACAAAKLKSILS